MNIFQILLIFVTFLNPIWGFCVPQERNHVLLHDGDQLSDDIYNFSIQMRKSDNCEQLLWIKFFIEWKWKYNENNYELLTQEIQTFQAAFSSYFDALLQKFKSYPVELILESVDASSFNNPEKPEEFTEIRTLFKCKSMLQIDSIFLEQDCDDTMRTLLENFQVKQFFLYFQEESISFDVNYDYFESEAAKEEILPSNQNSVPKVSIDVNFNKAIEKYPTSPIPSAQQTRMLQDQFEEIYDDVKTDDTADHLTRDFYIKTVIPIKNDEFSFNIIAEILFPWIDHKNLSDRDSKSYKKLQKVFSEYSERLYDANPISLNSKIKCKVDEILYSFEKIGHYFITIPNALIVNFQFQPIGFNISIENIKLLDGNIFDKIFENFKSEELFKAYERNQNEEYFVDRDGYIFDNSIAANEMKLKSSWRGDDVYDDFVDDEGDYVENNSSNSSNPNDSQMAPSNHVNSSQHPKSTKNVINTDNKQNNQVTTTPKELTIQDKNDPIVVIEATKMKFDKPPYSMTCEDCKVIIYKDFGLDMFNVDKEPHYVKKDDDGEEEEEGEEEDEVIDYSQYDYKSLEELNDFIDLTAENNDYESQEIVDETTDSVAKNEKIIEEPEVAETENIHKKFNPKDPMWKNIIDTSNIDASSNSTNEISIENHSTEDSSIEDSVEVFLPNLNQQNSSLSGEFTIVETVDVNQEETGVYEPLPSSDNYVMINGSQRLKNQRIFTIIFVIFVIVLL